MTKVQDIIDTWWKAPERLYHVVKVEDSPDEKGIRPDHMKGTTILVHAHIVKGVFTATTEDEQDYVNEVINDPSRYATSTLMKYRTDVNSFIQSIRKGNFVRLTKAEVMICLM